MKKTMIILFAVMALGFSNCVNKNKSQSQENQSIEDATEIIEESEEPELTLAVNADFIFLQTGLIIFYDLQTDRGTHYADEEDYVSNIVCTDQGMVYYSAHSNNRLRLKSLDLTVPDPKPVLLATWPVKLDDESEYPSYGNMFLNQDQSQIGLEVDFSWYGGLCNNLLVYDCESQRIHKIEMYHFDAEEGMMEFEEDIDFVPNNPEPNFNIELFEDGECLSYLGNGTPVCMSDPDKDKEYFSNIFEDIQPDHVPVSLDPTRTKVLFGASTYIGDGEVGYYAVSSLDGKDKMVLTSPSNMDVTPQWLKDGSLLFVDYDYDATLFLVRPDNMNPNGEFQTIGHTNKFCVLP